MKRYESMICSVCGLEWIVHLNHLMHPKAAWCPHCRQTAGRIAAATRPEDTQPGPWADLFEQVMLAVMLGKPAGEAGLALRTALGIDRRKQQAIPELDESKAG